MGRKGVCTGSRRSLLEGGSVLAGRKGVCTDSEGRGFYSKFG